MSKQLLSNSSPETNVCTAFLLAIATSAITLESRGSLKQVRKRNLQFPQKASKFLQKHSNSSV